MLDLNKDVKYIKGVGPARVKLLNNLGIYTLEDLITYFPRGYQDRSKPVNIAEAQDGEDNLIEGVCISNMIEKRIRRNMTIYKLSVRDQTGICNITWFNQGYLKGKFKIGNTYKFYGKVQKRIRVY